MSSKVDYWLELCEDDWINYKSCVYFGKATCIFRNHNA